MPFSDSHILLSHIDKGRSANNTGHTVYPKASYTDKAKKMAVICKKNKQGFAFLSSLEVALSRVAKRRFNPHTKANIALVIDKNDKTLQSGIYGVAIEHMAHLLEEQFTQEVFLTRKADGTFGVGGQKNNTPTVYFLDQFPNGFMHNLMQAKRNGALTVNTRSLGDVFASSHTLEEDDLHKGNIGFFVTLKEAKPHYTFFKIDDDLMLAEQIQSRYMPSLFHLHYKKEHFRITKEALEHLPALGIHARFWPTSKTYIHKLNDAKAYHDANDRAAFAALKDDDDFQAGKWHAYLRHILIPPSLTEKDISCGFVKPYSPQSKAHIALLTSAIASRTAELRAVLLTCGGFRAYLQTADINALADEIVYDDKENKALRQTIVDTFHRYQLFAEKEYVDDDTPLHVAVKLGDYRYEETWLWFGQYARQKNSHGKTPYDCALEYSKMPHAQQVDPRAHYLMMERDLAIRNHTMALQKGHIAQTLGDVHLQNIRHAQNKHDVLGVFSDISQDVRLSLKTKKEIAVACLQSFVDDVTIDDKKEILKTLQRGLNRGSSQPELQFVRQLRSEWWIVRFFRGLWGNTSTQDEMNRIIDKGLANTTRPSVPF